MPATAAVPRGPNRGIVLILLAHLAFTTLDATMKTLSADYGVAQIVWVFFIGFALAASVLAANDGGLRRGFATDRPALHVARALLLPINLGCVVLALSLLPLAETTAIGISYPLMITALSALVLGETVGPRRWTAVAVGFVGVMVIVRPGFAVFDPASLIPLAGAALFAVYQILTKILGRTDRTPTIALYTAWVGAIVLSAVAPFEWRTPDATGWALLALVAAAGATGHLLVIKALELTPASVLQPFNFVQILWATLAGFVVFGDLPDAATVAGAGLVVGSGLYVWWRERARAGAAG